MGLFDLPGSQNLRGVSLSFKGDVHGKKNAFLFHCTISHLYMTLYTVASSALFNFFINLALLNYLEIDIFSKIWARCFDQILLQLF